MERKQQCFELQSGFVKDHQTLNGCVGNDILKEDGLGEGEVRKSKASLEKEPSKGNAEAVPTSPAG